MIDMQHNNQSTQSVREPQIVQLSDVEQAMWMAPELTRQQVYALAAANLSDPLTVTETLSSADAERWKLAMDEEYNSLIKNGTWSLADLPTRRQPVTNKWIFKKKYDQNGQVTRFKARLVVRGFTQVYGEDYTDTLAPVAKFTTMRMVLAVATQDDLNLQQLDVKTAFLNGIIDEDIYMVQPEQYVKPCKQRKVCKLHKGIYGLKQFGRKWFQRLEKSLLKMGFVKSDSDPSLYIHRRGDSYVILLVYVDGILLASNSSHLLQVIKNLLSAEFEMTQLGEPAYLFGVEIRRDRQTGTLSLNQGKYIDDMLEKFR